MATGEALIVKLKNITEIPGADKIAQANLFGETVIISKEYKEGQLGLLFDSETILSEEFCRENNLFRHSNLNKDTSKAGFFDDKPRVRCITLKKIKTSGFFIPIESISYITTDFPAEGIQLSEWKGHKICQKYINQQYIRSKNTCKNNTRTKTSKIIVGQFKLSPDIEKLGKYIDTLKPDDLISIKYKIHGANFCISQVLCKKQLRWYEKALKYVGINIQDKEYSDIYASRRVIKNDDDTKDFQHFYGYDIWYEVYKNLQHALMPGISIYGEVCGFLKTGAYIQKDYDYGCKKHISKSYVFRITYTNYNGDIFEFSTPQIQDFCNKFDLNHVPIFYYGYLKDFSINTNEQLLEELISKYNNKNCYICKNIVPEEGIVLRNETYNKWIAYKLKSFNFLEREQKTIDEFQDIETQEFIDIKEDN